MEPEVTMIKRMMMIHLEWQVLLSLPESLSGIKLAPFALSGKLLYLSFN